MLPSEKLHTAGTHPLVRYEALCALPLRWSTRVYLGPASASHREWPCSFGLFLTDRVTATPRPGPRVFGVDRTGSHRTSPLPPLPPRGQRFRLGAACSSGPADSARLRPGWRRSPPRRLPTPFGVLGWIRSDPLETQPCGGPRRPRQTRPRRPALDWLLGPRKPRSPTSNSGGYRDATPYPGSEKTSPHP